MTILLDPTDERVPVTRQLAARAPRLKGTIALLDISKPRGDVLLDRLETLLKHNAPEIEVLRCAKPTFTKPAPQQLRDDLRAKVDLVVIGLAD
jgi:hypothetical protein